MRIKISDKIRKTKISDPKKIAKILTEVLKSEEKDDRMKEHFWAVYLNARNAITRIELIGLGVLNAGLIHPRETFRPAITASSASLIILHNHPSGEIEPSEDDLKTTKRIAEAGKILGIELFDHIIINLKNDYFSFKEKGLITD
ncbi:hypothetical protein KKG85_01820 [Patescibacteria group bacterium]|nr:hypothetical protein [Patescibacteria group bacterium]MBU2579883.1 hypothetical protein [Patescibacteria group bacterium]